MDNNQVSTREYFDAIYQRPVILEAKQLTQSFQHGKSTRTILNAIDLKIHNREFICVIGPSGCGKSTFSRIVAGLDPYTSGEILVDGEAIKGPSPERGMVFQGYTLFPLEIRERKCDVWPLNERSKQSHSRSAST